MDGLLKAVENKENEEEFSFSKYFIPLTTSKAITWIIIIGFFVYANMLFNGFVWDDLTFIIKDPDIHTFNIFSLFSQNVFNSGGYYRPIPAIYFSLLYNLFGNISFFYHFFQLSLHILDACLLFIFFKKFFKNNLSFFLVLLFLVHPIQVESVSYIGSSQSELLFLFGMISFLLSIRKKTNFSHMLKISVFLLLALLTKETSFLFILVILLYQYLFNKKSLIIYIVYTSIVICCYLIIRLFIATVPFEQYEVIPIGHLSLFWRILNIPGIFFYYIKTFFYPAVLNIDQNWITTSINWSQFYFPLILDLLFFILLLYLANVSRRKHSETFNLFLFFFIWFLSGAGMLMQLFPLDNTVADHWMYFPIVGLLGLLGISYTVLPVHIREKKRLWLLLAVMLIVILSIRTMVRNINWVDQITLISHDSQYNDNWQMENLLGVAYFNENRNNEALIHFGKALKSNPIDSNYYNIAQAYGQEKKYTLAEKYYLLAINTYNGEPGDTTLYSAYNQLATMTAFYEDPNRAKIYAQNGLKKFPSDGKLWADLALSDYNLHKYQEALSAIEKANVYLPNDPNIQLLYSQIQTNISKEKVKK